MRAGFAGLVLVLAAGACTRDIHSHAQLEWPACQSAAFPQRRIEACSAVIVDPQTEPALRAEALVQRGMLRAQAGEQIRAIADFGRALRLDANNVRAYAERGLVHQNRGAFDVALRDYDAALRLQPSFSIAVQRREEALQGMAQASLSQLEELNRMIAANPDNPALWNNRCWERAVRGVELEFALSDCDRALTLAPQSAQALDSRGLVHYKRGEFDAARADYEAALALEPNNGHFLFGRGLARDGLGDKAGAETDFAAAERAQPGVRQLYRGYGVAI